MSTVSIMERLGPGMWNDIHGLAEEFYNDIPIFIRCMIGIFRKIPCGECARDSFNYLDSNPPSDPVAWACDFHNHVNKKIGKKKYSCYRHPRNIFRGNAIRSIPLT